MTSLIDKGIYAVHANTKRKKDEKKEKEERRSKKAKHDTNQVSDADDKMHRYALFSQGAYLHTKVARQKLLKDFKLDGKWNINEKYNKDDMVVYHNNHQQPGEPLNVVAFKGTRDFKDLIADGFLAAGKMKSYPRYKRMKTEIERIQKDIGSDLVLTGHSLGGAYAYGIANDVHVPSISFNQGSGVDHLTDEKGDSFSSVQYTTNGSSFDALSFLSYLGKKPSDELQTVKAKEDANAHTIHNFLPEVAGDKDYYKNLEKLDDESSEKDKTNKLVKHVYDILDDTDALKFLSDTVESTLKGITWRTLFVGVSSMALEEAVRRGALTPAAAARIESAGEFFSSFRSNVARRIVARLRSVFGPLEDGVRNVRARMPSSLDEARQMFNDAVDNEADEGIDYDAIELPTTEETTEMRDKMIKRLRDDYGLDENGEPIEVDPDINIDDGKHDEPVRQPENPNMDIEPIEVDPDLVDVNLDPTPEIQSVGDGVEAAAGGVGEGVEAAAEGGIEGVEIGASEMLGPMGLAFAAITIPIINQYKIDKFNDAVDSSMHKQQAADQTLYYTMEHKYNVDLKGPIDRFIKKHPRSNSIYKKEREVQTSGQRKKYEYDFDAFYGIQGRHYLTWYDDNYKQLKQTDGMRIGPAMKRMHDVRFPYQNDHQYDHMMENYITDRHRMYAGYDPYVYHDNEARYGYEEQMERINQRKATEKLRAIQYKRIFDKTIDKHSDLDLRDSTGRKVKLLHVWNESANNYDEAVIDNDTGKIVSSTSYEHSVAKVLGLDEWGENMYGITKGDQTMPSKHGKWTDDAVAKMEKDWKIASGISKNAPTGSYPELEKPHRNPEGNLSKGPLTSTNDDHTDTRQSNPADRHGGIDDKTTIGYQIGSASGTGAGIPGETNNMIKISNQMYLRQQNAGKKANHLPGKADVPQGAIPAGGTEGKGHPKKPKAPITEPGNISHDPFKSGDTSEDTYTSTAQHGMTLKRGAYDTYLNAISDQTNLGRAADVNFMLSKGWRQTRF